MFKRAELVLYFDNGTEVDEFLRTHVVSANDEPWISPKVRGYAIRQVRYPSTPTEPLDIRLSEYDRKTEGERATDA